MCGIIALLLANEYGHANQFLYDGLTVLQHRGQDAAGIITSHHGRLHLRKDNGLVRDVFLQKHMINLMGSMGIGHCRYPTAGTSSCAEAQPFYTNSPYGIALAHNGNLTNSKELIEDLASRNFRHINTDSDSELLLNVLADELLNQKSHPLNVNQIFDAVTRLFNRCKGGFSAVALINGHGILAFRDRHGIRPLVYGTRDTLHGKDYVIASESVAIDTLGFALQRDVAPGEAILIKDGELFTKQCCLQAQLSPCIFEYVYFARPDSVMDGVSVYQARLNMGQKLAEKIINQKKHVNIDVIIPIPDTSRTSALEASKRMGIPYREGFVKNRYISRTFIMPGQAIREKTVRLKLNAIRSEFQDKEVLLVDDSIVRGTTAKQIVQIARENGAKAVYFASAAPAVRYPNVYGIDMPTKDELVAHGRTEKEVSTEIGADWVIYQDLDALQESVAQENRNISKFDSSCFDGIYATGDINEDYFNALRNERNDAAKEMRNDSLKFHRTFSDPLTDEVIDMHNQI